MSASRLIPPAERASNSKEAEKVELRRLRISGFEEIELPAFIFVLFDRRVQLK